MDHPDWLDEDENRVAHVRELFFDALTPDQAHSVRNAAEAVLERISGHTPGEPSPTDVRQLRNLFKRRCDVAG